MSKKYVIEINPEYEDSFQGVMLLGAKDSNLYVDTLSIEGLEELNSDYINEHYGDLQDQAYQKGLEVGKQTAVGAAELREKLEYQKGFEDGKAQVERGCEGCEYGDTPQCNFPCFNCSNNYPNNWTANKIEVGDEVEVLNSGSKYLIAWVAGTSICGFAHDGMTCHLQPSDVRKTGRHFDIEKILKEMRND